MKSLFLITVLFLSACTMAPTKVGQSQSRAFNMLVDKTLAPIDLTDQTVVLDARSRFDYGLNHVFNAINFPWDNLAETTESGEVIRDLRKAGLKLSLNGLRPNTPVVVVGSGLKGRGEEGRLAWTLLYLGFQDVQVAALENFRNNLTPNDVPPPKNVEQWPVNPRPEMQVLKPEFAKLMVDPKGRLENRIFVIDVRSAQEYANIKPGPAGPAPDINALHMEWKEFYNEKGRPNARVKSKLESLGIKSNDRVILISNKGIRSGAAAYALLALGFTRVQNFTGGWNSLLTDRL